MKNLRSLLKIVSIVTFVLISFSCSTVPKKNIEVSTKHEPELDSIEVIKKAKELSMYYTKIREGNSDSTIKLFFDVFPESFSNLDKIYGFSNGNPHPLYGEISQGHLEMFWDSEKIVGQEAFLQKVINLSIDGHWDADAINFFQKKLENYVNTNLATVISGLENYSTEEISSFWTFLFEGPSPPKSIPIDIESIKNQNLTIAELAMSAYQKAKEEWDLGN